MIEMKSFGKCNTTIIISGTAGIRGTRILNNGRYFWELKVSQRVFGTR